MRLDQRVKTVVLNDNSRLFVVGDLHGHYNELMRILMELSFNFEKDLLVILGDFIDRGPYSKECSTLPLESWVEAVLGNHEESCIRGFKDPNLAIYHKQPENGGAWFYKLNEPEQQQVVSLFKDLPILLEVQANNKVFGFVHADVPVEDWELLKELVVNDDLAPDDESYAHKCVWKNSIFKKTEAFIAFVDQVFIGHTFVVEPRFSGNCAFLETGVSMKNGKLTVWEVQI